MHASQFTDTRSKDSGPREQDHGDETQSIAFDKSSTRLPECADTSENSPTFCLYSERPSNRSDDVIEDQRDCHLYRSFDMIFQLNQRAAEIRLLIDRIDRLILRSRSVGALSDRILCCLEDEMDLLAARILIRENHPIASILEHRELPGIGKLPSGFLENEGFYDVSTFVLDDPAGELSNTLFQEDAQHVSSAAVARLFTYDEAIGLLCLASDDPTRYCGGANTDLVATLADRIALGLRNAWDHERGRTAALYGKHPGLFSRALFDELLSKECYRALRYDGDFSLAAISWSCAHEDEGPLGDQVIDLLVNNVRCSDIAAQGDRVKLWMLLPNTDEEGAAVLVRRLFRFTADFFSDKISLHAGVARMSKQTTEPSALADCARRALESALSKDADPLVIH
jgi:hypothetical protein